MKIEVDDARVETKAVSEELRQEKITHNATKEEAEKQIAITQENAAVAIAAARSAAATAIERQLAAEASAKEASTKLKTTQKDLDDCRETHITKDEKIDDLVKELRAAEREVDNAQLERANAKRNELPTPDEALSSQAKSLTLSEVKPPDGAPNDDQMPPSGAAVPTIAYSAPPPPTAAVAAAPASAPKKGIPLPQQNKKNNSGNKAQPNKKGKGKK